MKVFLFSLITIVNVPLVYKDILRIDAKPFTHVIYRYFSYNIRVYFQISVLVPLEQKKFAIRVDPHAVGLDQVFWKILIFVEALIRTDITMKNEI